MKLFRHSLILLIFITITASASGTQYTYTVHKGKITVFGYTLHSKQIVATGEGEYYVSFQDSPDGEKVLIIYDVPFENGAVWLYDKKSKKAPQPVGSSRIGRHFGAEWYGNNVFALYGAGMGYKTLRLFRTEQLKHYREIDGLLKYDEEKDIYAQLKRDKAFDYFIVIGRAFHKLTKEESFRLDMYSDDIVSADTGDYIKGLEFDRRGVTVHYINKAQKDVTVHFDSKNIEKPIPNNNLSNR